MMIDHLLDNLLRRLLQSFSSALICFLLISSQLFGSTFTEVEPGRPIDIVFMIDISGSTGGILPSIRAKFWEMQNEITRLSPTPDYRIGIVCMGRPSFKKENQYVKIISDLTNDFDAAAYPFFQIKDVAAPGNYFLGHALDVAVNDLSWSNRPDAIKLIFLAGNGKPSAGPGFKKPLMAAIENGITIHSLYFQTYFNQKEQSEWKTIADNTGGTYAVIDLKESAIVLDKPYDGKMLKESGEMINSTYVYYGRNGLERSERQADLDEEANLLGANEVEERTFFKATEMYQGNNYAWDLVDLRNSGKGVPLKKNRKLMDESVRSFSDGEFVQYITKKGFERKEYVSIIKMLSAKREHFLRNKREKMKNFRSAKTFSSYVKIRLVETAKEKGFSIKY